MSLNKAFILGNLTRDPELRTTPAGQSVTSFGVATNRVWTNQKGEKQEQVEYHNIVAWGKLAEIVSQYLGKGRKVFVEGRLQTREWEGQDGVKRYRTEIIAENLQMLDRPQGDRAPNAIPQGTNTQTPQSLMPENNNNDNDEGIKIEAIPF